MIKSIGSQTTGGFTDPFITEEQKKIAGSCRPIIEKCIKILQTQCKCCTHYFTSFFQVCT